MSHNHLPNKRYGYHGDGLIKVVVISEYGAGRTCVFLRAPGNVKSIEGVRDCREGIGAIMPPDGAAIDVPLRIDGLKWWGYRLEHRRIVFSHAL